MADTYIKLPVEGGGSSTAIDTEFTPDGDISATNVQDAIVEVRDDTDSKLSAKQSISEKGVANGYASLDVTGRVPSSQLTVSALEYKGTWDASTNTPALASGVGTQGDVYIVTVAGTTNLDGETDWEVGDQALFNGTAWGKLDNTSPVTSVAGKVGVITLDTDDVSEATNLYYTDVRVSANADVAANTTHRNTTGNPHATTAAQVGYTGTLTATDVANALDELDAGKQDFFVTVVSPSGVAATDITNITNAVNTLNAAGGGKLQLTEGSFDVGTGIAFGDVSNIRITGQGSGTVINCTTNYAFQFIGTDALTEKSISNYSSDATSITLTTAADASNLSPGDTIVLQGTETASGSKDYEANEVVSADGGTGIVTLLYPTQFNMTTATVIGYSGCKGIEISDLRIAVSGTAVDAIQFLRGSNIRIDNIDIEGIGVSPTVTQACIRLQSCVNVSVKGSRFFNIDACDGIQLTITVNAEIEKNTLQGLNISGTANQNPIDVTNDCAGITISKNRILSCGGTAIAIDRGVGEISRVNILNNEIINTVVGILVEASDCLVSENLIYNTSSDGISLASVQRRCKVAGNRLIGIGSSGISAVAGGQVYQIESNIIKGTTSFGISVSGANASVQDNLIENTLNTGINISTGSNALVSNNSIINSDGNAAIYANGAAGSVEGNYINTTATGTRGIWVTNAGDETRISNNTLLNVQSSCVQVDANAFDLLITANRITAGLGVGILLSNLSSRASITGNSILNCSGNGIQALAGGGTLEFFTITANICEGNGGDGMRLGGLTDCSIMGNICTGNTGDGIEFADSGATVGDFCSVVHNVLRGNTGTNFNNTATGASNNITGNIV